MVNLKLSGTAENLEALEPVLRDVLNAANTFLELSTPLPAGVRFTAEIQ